MDDLMSDMRVVGEKQKRCASGDVQLMAEANSRQPARLGIQFYLLGPLDRQPSCVIITSSLPLFLFLSTSTQVTRILFGLFILFSQGVVI